MSRRKPTRRRHPNQDRRSTALQFEKRVDEVFTLLLNGLGQRDIRRFVASDECAWKASNRQIDRYIAAAKKKFEEYAEPDLKQEYGRALQRLDDLYTRCKKIQDYGRCLAVLQETSRLLGLNKPQRFEHGGPDGKPIPIEDQTPPPDPARAATIARLLVKLGIIPATPPTPPDTPGPAETPDEPDRRP